MLSASYQVLILSQILQNLFVSSEYKSAFMCRHVRCSILHNLLTSDFPVLACVMVIAWVLCGSIGIILGQYYKAMWTNTKTCGQKAWFAYHRALMLCAMIFTIIGFILILIFRNGKFVLPPQLPTKAHPIIGLIAIICSLLNVSSIYRLQDCLKLTRPCFTLIAIVHYLIFLTLFGFPQIFNNYQFCQLIVFF